MRASLHAIAAGRKGLRVKERGKLGDLSECAEIVGRMEMRVSVGRAWLDIRTMPSAGAFGPWRRCLPRFSLQNGGSCGLVESLYRVGC